MNSVIERNYRPVIIIGAPRSGTNMLRDVLASLPGVGTWPCDEINPIWRHGNTHYPNDDFSPEMARPEVCRFVRKRFDRLAQKDQLNQVVEKTCANSLRVAFVDRVLPDAFFIHIVRDGMDAVASAKKRWHAPLDIGYAFRKARFIPPSDLPRYALSHMKNRFFRLIGTERRLRFWGPRTREIEQALAEGGVVDACALQWRQCVEAAEQDLSRLSPSRVCRVRYEDFVRQPETETLRICRSAGLFVSPVGLSSAVMQVTAASIGRGRAEMQDDTAEKVRSLIGDVLERYDYG